MNMKSEITMKGSRIAKTKNQFVFYTPKSENQKKYVEYLKNENVHLILATGPAGTGKTLFACLQAISLLKNGDVSKVIITRPSVTVEEDLGFLPGNINKKMEPWTQPIFDIFLQYFTKQEIDQYIYNGIIEISPLGFMRGRTFRDAFIIADEMQNSSPNQMKMLTTRIGEKSKMIITGDLNQSDKMGEMNGLYHLMKKIDDYKVKGNKENKENEIEEMETSIKVVRFLKEDVERSKIVQTIVNIYASNEGGFRPKKFDLTDNEKELYNVNNDAALIPRKYL